MTTMIDRRRPMAAVFARRLAVLALLLGVVAAAANGATAQEPDAALTTYTNPTYGYSLSYDPETTFLAPEGFGDQATLVVDGIAVLQVIGRTAYGGDPSACVEAGIEEYAFGSGVSGVQPLLDATGAPVAGTTEVGGVYATMTYTRSGRRSTEQIRAYFECHTVQAGSSVVLFRYSDIPGRYEGNLPPVLAIIASLVIPELDAPAAPTEMPAPASIGAVVSPTYGFSFAYEPAVWTPAFQLRPTDQDPQDTTGLYHADRGEATLLLVTGLAGYGGDAAACIEAEVAKAAGNPTFSNVRPMLDDAGAEVRGTSAAGGAFAVVALSRDGVESIGYLECRTLEPGSSVVRISMVANADTYEVDVADAEDVFASITVDSTLINATPTA